jgi:hypothetical protein
VVVVVLGVRINYWVVSVANIRRTNETGGGPVGDDEVVDGGDSGGWAD